jgi:hypothetical protein
MYRRNVLEDHHHRSAAWPSLSSAWTGWTTYQNKQRMFEAVMEFRRKDQGRSKRWLPPGVVEADADPLLLGLVGRHLVAQPAFPHQDRARLGLDIDEGPRSSGASAWRVGAAIIIGRRGSSNFRAEAPGGMVT